MLVKFAVAEIIGAPQLVTGRGGLIKGAHRATFDYQPRTGYLYVRSRMISSRCNDNYDEFPAEEIEKGYRTFIGKPVFVNHHNEDHRRMRGVIIDAVLHKDANPDGSKDWWVEGLMEVDAIKFPKLAKALIKQEIQRTSMGVDVAYSICSACNNKASTPADYCRHIPQAKGSKIWRADVKTGAKRGELVREICHGLGFFENSLLVEDPADPTAYFLGKVEMGPGLEHLSTLVDEPTPTAYPPAYRTTGTRRTASRQEPTLTVGSLRLVTGAKCHECDSLNTVAVQQTGATECVDCSAQFNSFHPGRTAARRSIQVEAKPKHADPADHPWFQENPVHHDNIVEHWNGATDDEKEQGRRWYADAHIVSKALGEKYLPNHPHGAAHAAAGIVANYSPQQGWAGNLHNAARVMHEGKGIGGPGSGMFASGSQKAAADKIIGGEHYNDVLRGPKIQDFAHLIEHGKDEHEENPKTVVDRHALSVATGKRMSTDDYGAFPKTQRHYYGHVVSKYNEAARQISEKEVAAGREPVAAHQVQAATWLVRQRRNQEGEKANAAAGGDTRLDRGREKARTNAEEGWTNWHQTHMPDLEHKGPGTGYVKDARANGGRPQQGARFPGGR